MNKNSIVIILVLLVFGVGAYLLMNRTAATNPDALMEDSTNPTSAAQEDRVMQQESASEASVEEGTLKEFTVISKPFLFNQKELRVKKGDTVRITLDNQEGTHDFVIDEFNAKTKTLNAGQEETIEFVADKAGTFEFYCSVGNHRAMGMTGNLIVE